MWSLLRVEGCTYLHESWYETSHCVYNIRIRCCGTSAYHNFINKKLFFFCTKATCFSLNTSHPQATCKKYADKYQKVEISVHLDLVIRAPRSQHLLWKNYSKSLACVATALWTQRLTPCCPLKLTAYMNVEHSFVHITF